MAQVIVSLLAQADTDCIVTDLAEKAGYNVAAGYVASFEAIYARLAAHPDSGAPRPAIGRHVRIGIASPYIVIYEYVEASDTVTIFRIVHGRRKISGKLLRGG
jgi:plasmid stabilization system protein ParE